MKLNNKLNISNTQTTELNNELILLNNEYFNNSTILNINDNNTIGKEETFNISDLTNLNLNDTNILIGYLEYYCTNKSEAYYILNELIESLTLNKKYGYCEIDNNYIQNYYNNQIALIESEKENRINIEKEKEIFDIKHNINLMLINTPVNATGENGEDLNPLNLRRSLNLPQYIAMFLSTAKGLILRSNVNTPHLLNTNNKCYELTNNENLLRILANEFGNNTISMKELIKSYDYINNRLKPQYNIIRFNNSVYDMNQHKTIKLTSPCLPFYDIYFNYNPKAKGDLIQEFLYTSLESEEKIKGLLELIGYLFTVGNKENIILCFIGIGGSGKSVLSNILRYIFKRVSNLPIHNLNGHDLMSLENQLLNICNDTDNKKIKDNGTFKQVTGGDSLYINPKYREPYTMPPEEVPYFLIVGNNFPQFEQLEIPIIERLMLIEFKKGFRGTKKQNKNLYNDIISDKDNIEWLIYNSLEAYKQIAINNKSFTLKKTTKENLDLYNKHSKPLIWIIKQLIEFDNNNIIEESITVNDLTNYMVNYIGVEELKTKVLNYAKSQGLDLNLKEDNNLSTNRLTKAIKSSFNLWNSTETLGIEYNTKQVRKNNKKIYVYPYLRFKE